MMPRNASLPRSMTASLRFREPGGVVIRLAVARAFETGDDTWFAHPGGYAPAMFRPLRGMPFLRFLAIIQIALLARRHFNKLDPGEPRRPGELIRRGPALDRTERSELFRLLNKVEPRAFA